MICVDTNILVRHITQDDAGQSARATRFIDRECSASTPGFVALIVLIQLVRVSESNYGAGRDEIAEILHRILSIEQLVVERPESAWKALRLFQTSKADFADCLIHVVAGTAGCSRVMTFDRQASKAGMTLLR